MEASELELFDAHLHLGWFADPVAVAREAQARGLGMLAVTVTPEEYRRLEPILTGEQNVALAAGLHPWWVRGGRDVRDARDCHDAHGADDLAALLEDLRWVGEIGLDASPRRAGTWDAQLAAFEAICAACARTSEPAAPKVLSIHAVRCTGAVLDVLERTGVADACRCVLHWFSGSSDELWRAMRLGCRVSLGERALATRRGREYARVLPEERLLLETDLPASEGAPGSVDEVISSLERAAQAVAEARGENPEDVRRLTTRNALELLA